jgi:hypothetical protein
MEIHQFKTLKVSFRNVCLSEVLDENDSKCETFQARSLGITQIDKLQFSCIKIKKLDLSQNRIVHLSGLFQFPNLTNLNLSQNLIQSLTELLNIKNKSNLLFLQVNSNPFARHPNVLSLVVQLFPRLKKFDDVQVTDDLKQEIFDGKRLEKKIPEFFKKNLEMIEKYSNDVQRLKIQYELLQACKGKFNQAEGPYWEDINSRHLKDLKKLKKIPSFPSFFKSFEYKTSRINDFVDLYGKTVTGIGEFKVFELNAISLLFKQVMKKLHSWGLHNLQLFINENAQDCLEEEVKFFLSLSIFSQSKLLKTEKPAKNLIPIELNSDHPVIENLNHFPIFPDNKNYLKAIFECLSEQVNILEDLNREQEELLSFDASCLGIPSLADRFFRSEDLVEESFEDFSQVFSRFDAPVDGKKELGWSHSFRYEEKQDDETFTEIKKIFEISDELVKFEEKSKKNFHQILENILKQISMIFLNRMKNVMKDLLFFSHKKLLKTCKNLRNLQKSEEFFRGKGLFKVFRFLKGLRNFSKCQSVKALNFYTGRLKLDVFYSLKSFSLRQKRLKRALQVKKTNEIQEKVKIKQEVEEEFGKIVSRLTENQSNIKRIWKILNNEEKSKCSCGGFKCENCTTKKMKFIKKELGFLKTKISKDLKNRC